MNVIYEHKPVMTLIGFSTTIRPDKGYMKCPEFWDKEYSQKYARLWQTMVPETPMERAILENSIGTFGICEEKADGFTYWIAGLYKGGEVPEGLKLYTFPESDWAMFSAKSVNRFCPHVGSKTDECCTWCAERKEIACVKS